MDESFKVRVEKIFGSLTSSSSSSEQSPSSSLQSTLWSLTDDEVERRRWRRDSSNSDRDEIPCSTSFDESKKDRIRNFRREQDLVLDIDDDYVDGKSSTVCIRGGTSFCDADELDVISSIGLDPTLDNEEEEDEYDKVALGREYDGPYMEVNDVKEHSCLNIHELLAKDRRANHLAAKIRLHENDAEDEAVNLVNSKQHCDVKESGTHLKSILKRKDSGTNNSYSKSSSKRVRFHPSCRFDVCNGEEEEEASPQDDDNDYISNGIPDYLRYPSKYTCYSFNSKSSEVEDEYRRNSIGSGSADLPKSVVFIPRNKVNQLKEVTDSRKAMQEEDDDDNQSLHNTGLSLVGIAAGESNESQADVVEEVDEPETNAVPSHKVGRMYRTKSRADETDP